MNAHGAHQPLAVAPFDDARSEGVDFSEAPAEGALALDQIVGLGRITHGLRHGRNVGQPPRQGHEIEACAADEDGGPALGPEFGQQLQDGPAPFADGPGLGRIDHAIKPMVGHGLVFRRRPGGQDSQVGIQLLAVGVDDHRPGFARYFQGEGGLARGGRAGEQGD